MRTKHVNLYQFDELDDRAKEKAREWYRRRVFDDSSDWEFVYEDAVRVGAILGIEIDTRAVKLMGGDVRRDPVIYFSGFSSQGDGACFEASYAYVKSAAKKIREYAPEDKVLHQIADDLQAIQRRNFYRLTASTKHRGYYNHSGCMAVTVEDREDRYRDIGDAEEGITACLRSFADWIYDTLKSEYEYQTSDEAVDEAIEANEYEFTEDGERA